MTGPASVSNSKELELELGRKLSLPTKKGQVARLAQMFREALILLAPYPTNGTLSYYSWNGYCGYLPL